VGIRNQINLNFLASMISKWWWWVLSTWWWVLMNQELEQRDRRIRDRDKDQEISKIT